MSYWYLATPYKLFQAGREAAFIEAKDQTAKLLLAGIPTYSPIVHNHLISLKPELFDKANDFDFWVKFVDLPLMQGAGGLLVCTLEGWQDSSGVRFEIDFFEAQRKPVYFYDPSVVPSLPSLDVLHSLNVLAHRCREANDTWWRDPVTGEPIKRNRGELLALIHSEISEAATGAQLSSDRIDSLIRSLLLLRMHSSISNALEGVRKGLMDDHLPQFPMELVELADTLIRIFDYVGEYYPASENDSGINLGNAFEQKMAYNAQRKDHKPENRMQENGKQF